MTRYVLPTTAQSQLWEEEALAPAPPSVVALPTTTPETLQGTLPTTLPATHTHAPAGPHTLYTAGYRGQTLASFRRLQARLDAMVVDIRYEPHTGSTWHRWNLHRELTRVEDGSPVPYYYWCQALGNPNYRGEGEMHLMDPEIGLALLEEVLQRHAVIALCACEEWRTCHRQLIAEAMVSRGYQAEHLPPSIGKLAPQASQASFLA